MPRSTTALVLLLPLSVGAFLTGAPSAAVDASAAETPTAGPVPDFSGIWTHPYWPGFDPPPSGTGPIVNKSRMPNGIGNSDQLVGDYNNPILKPQAAEVVKRYGEISLTGVTYPTPANQCWPQPVPYILWTIGIQMLQQRGGITILYSNPDHEVRHVRMNQSHPALITPSWYGDSVGHYEGDALVVDTVGVQNRRPYAMADIYGTPYSEALHVTERYRLVDDETARAAEERTRKENLFIPLNDSGLAIDQNHKGKALQLEFTVEDPGSFTRPWSASMTYRRASGAWPEFVCSENAHRYDAGKDPDIPRSGKPDF
jgi:hypothetical protein